MSLIEIDTTSLLFDQPENHAFEKKNLPILGINVKKYTKVEKQPTIPDLA